jgi:hypothetical protein
MHIMFAIQTEYTTSEAFTCLFDYVFMIRVHLIFFRITPEGVLIIQECQAAQTTLQEPLVLLSTGGDNSSYLTQSPNLLLATKGAPTPESQTHHYGTIYLGATF